MIQQDTTNTDSSWVKHIRCTGTKWSPGESVDCGCDRSVCYLGPIGGSVLLANVFSSSGHHHPPDPTTPILCVHTR